LEQYMQKYGRAPRVLDPFAGGGSIPLEALRLGCETYASDYNPVAVFIEKATLEWPQRFGIEVELPREIVEGGPDQLAFGDSGDTVNVNLLAHLVERWSNIILEEVQEEIGQFYPTDSADGLVGKRETTEEEGWIPVGYLWARTIPCQNPTCGSEIPLIKRFWLAKKKDKRIAYRPVVDKANKQVDFELLEDAEAIEAADFDPSEGTVHRGDARCLICGQITKAKDVRRLAREGRMAQRMVAVVFHHPDQYGRRYRLTTMEDEGAFAEAAAYLDQRLAEWPYLESPMPTEDMTPNARYMLPTNYGMEEWQELFNARQKLALLAFVERIRGCPERVTEGLENPELGGQQVDQRELGNAVAGCLGIILAKCLDWMTSLNTYLNYAEKPSHLFTRQALPMAGTTSK
jgi:putative DNA methylase